VHMINYLHNIESPTFKFMAVPIAQALLVVTISFWALNLGEYDLSVPFNYTGDSIIILMYIKGLLQDGWPTVISQLSAPFSYSGAAFPILTSFDWTVMKGIALFTNEPGLILNLFWLLTLVFSAWSSGYAGYQVGLSRPSAFVIGILYAFLPYALLRNVAHLSLVYYLVPLLCLLAIIIATHGKGIRNLRQAMIVGLVACVLQGFNYIYYSFFAALLFGVAAALAWHRAGGFRQFRLPVVAILFVSLATAINLLPFFISKSENGPPPEMGYKFTAEAEIFGAKIRRMIVPHHNNIITPLAWWAKRDKEAQFPNENENVTARLGLFGAAGLFLSILIVLRLRAATASSIPAVVYPLASLSIATLFIITVGGLGAVINVLTVPDIRAYNRFSVFLSFFTMVALAVWAQSKVDSLVRWRRRLALLAVFSFAIFSLYDQLLYRQHLLASQQRDVTRAREERQTVDALEQALPDGAAVLQLPLTGFPPLAKFHNMMSYDHARAYLWSHDLKWSWPSFSIRHRAWQTRIAEKRGIDLIHAAILSGFQAIWIDRAAYADNGLELISSLTQGRVVPIPLQNDRFVVLDLREEAVVLRSLMTQEHYDRLADDILGPAVVMEWKGFYGEEKSVAGLPFRWSKNKSRMTIRNLSNHEAKVCLRFSIASPHPGMVKLIVGKSEIRLSTSTSDKLFSLPISLPAGHVKKIHFHADMARLEAVGDPRSLYFHVMDYRADVFSDTAQCGNNGR